MLSSIARPPTVDVLLSRFLERQKTGMTKPPSLLYVFWIGVVIGYSQPVQSLTVFRIGGEGLPLPVFENPTDFVQLSWSDVSAAQHGAVDLVTIGL